MTTIKGVLRYIAVNSLVIATLSAMVNQAGAQAARPSGMTDEELFGTVIRKSKWETLPISVCWENPSREDSKYRAITRRAVEETWEKHSAVRFVDWGKCTEKSSGVRIHINDEGPHTKALGRYLAMRPQGMVLNFTFENWSTGCQKELDYCVYVVAAHEFGHALGFAHEQNRDDAPKQCRDEKRQGTDGDYKVTKYDPDSIMNYCSASWNGDGKLSPLDIEAVQKFYGK